MRLLHLDRVDCFHAKFDLQVKVVKKDPLGFKEQATINWNFTKFANLMALFATYVEEAIAMISD